MTTLGLDFAGGRPGGAAIKAAGYDFVVRYLTAGGPGLPGKLLTADEYADLMAHGVAVVLNFETTADRMRAGRAAGIIDAGTADRVATALGVPQDRPVLFSADWDATPAEQGAIDEYLRGAASVIGPDRVGVYGSYYVCKRSLDNGTAKWAWQTGAWSGGQVEPRAHIYQRIGYVTVGGVQCDVNEALQPDYGQHPGGDVSATEVWNYLMPDPYIAPDGTVATAKTAGDLLGWAATHAAYAKELALANQKRLDVLQVAVTTLTSVVTTGDLTAAAIRSIFDEELAKVVDVRISVVGLSPVVTPAPPVPA